MARDPKAAFDRWRAKAAESSFTGWSRWPSYVSIADRRLVGERHAAELRREGRRLAPVVPKTRSRVLARTFWGRAWCDNLAAYATLANRLERGRRYLRNGLVIDLQIQSGAVVALVSGSDVYEIRVAIKPMPASRWKALVKGAAGRIESVVELLAGRFDEGVMAHVCHQGTGLFPVPAEISYRCTCPDGSGGGWLCKHVGATLYGVGIRLDEDPELLFRLRRVTATDLVTHATERLTTESSGKSGRRSIASDQLSSVFGIELDAASREGTRPPRARSRRSAGNGRGKPGRPARTTRKD
jgi:uncharacterized Zn finger protein